MTYFATGFWFVAKSLLLITGGAMAVALFLAVLLLVICLAGVVFDRVTQAMAQRWERTGKHPSGRLGQIILEHYRRQRE